MTIFFHSNEYLIFVEFIDTSHEYSGHFELVTTAINVRVAWFICLVRFHRWHRPNVSNTQWLIWIEETNTVCCYLFV